MARGTIWEKIQLTFGRNPYSSATWADWCRNCSTFLRWEFDNLAPGRAGWNMTSASHEEPKWPKNSLDHSRFRQKAWAWVLIQKVKAHTDECTQLQNLWLVPATEGAQSQRKLQVVKTLGSLSLWVGRFIFGEIFTFSTVESPAFP